MQAYAQAAKFTGPLSSKALIGMHVQPGGGESLGNATASLTPSAGVEGPVYFNTSHLPDPTLTTTSNTQGGIIFEVEPGDYEASVAHPTLNCAPQSIFWVGKDAAHAKIHAVAGYLTVVVFSCY